MTESRPTPPLHQSAGHVADAHDKEQNCHADEHDIEHKALVVENPISNPHPIVPNQARHASNSARSWSFATSPENVRPEHLGHESWVRLEDHGEFLLLQ
jgi:hypothetical protein